MSTQSEALRLANEPFWDDEHCVAAAAELRRLHAENKAMSETSSQVIADNVRLHALNAELLEALKLIVQWDDCGFAMTDELIGKALAAIAKAEGEQA